VHYAGKETRENFLTIENSGFID